MRKNEPSVLKLYGCFALYVLNKQGVFDIKTLDEESKRSMTEGEKMEDVPRVVIYTAATCPYCRQAKELLEQEGVEFTDKDVATDLTARQEMVQKSGQLGVPVIEINGKIVVGFNRAKILQNLE